MPVLPGSVADAAVRTARPDDVPRLADSLAAAFFEDPVMAWLLPDPGGRPERLRRFFELELRLVGLGEGCAWTTDRLDAAALVSPPGHWRLPWSAAVRHGPRFMRAFGVRLPLATALLQTMEHRHIREPHFYIPYIGVAPPSQGRGLGTQLMAPTLSRCDHLGLPAYLEATSPRNVVLYERLGFIGLDELRFLGSPPLVLMRRPAPA